MDEPLHREVDEVVECGGGIKGAGIELAVVFDESPDVVVGGAEQQLVRAVDRGDVLVLIHDPDVLRVNEHL